MYKRRKRLQWRRKSAASNLDEDASCVVHSIQFSSFFIDNHCLSVNDTTWRCWHCSLHPLPCSSPFRLVLRRGQRLFSALTSSELSPSPSPSASPSMSSPSPLRLAPAGLITVASTSAPVLAAETVGGSAGRLVRFTTVGDCFMPAPCVVRAPTRALLVPSRRAALSKDAMHWVPDATRQCG